MKDEGDINFNDSEASNALSIMQGTQYLSNSLRIRSTMKYDKERAKEMQSIKPQTVINNSGTILNSAIGNTHSDSSNALFNPVVNITNTQNAQPKTKRSLLEKLAWIAGILAVIIPIMMYFKIYPFNK